MAKTRFKNKKILQLLLRLRDCAQWDFITHFFHAFFFFKADFAVVLFSRCKLS